MSDIILDADGLEPGMVIKEAVKIQAECSISVSEYLCLLVEQDGEDKRLLFPVGHVTVPALHYAKMLKLLQAGSEFFTIDEIVERENGGHIVERPGGKLVEGQRSIEEIWIEKGNKTRLTDDNPINNEDRVEIPLE